MTRRKFSREFKIEAVRLVTDRGVAVAQAARDLDVAESVRALGAEVVGPVSSLQKALDAIDAEPALDGAVLDVNLQGIMVFPAADRLVELDVPFFFTTGYDQRIIPDRYAATRRCEKPVSGPRLKQALLDSFKLGS